MTINYGGTCIGTHYAVVVIPCALLSTWLFLSKQRKPLAKSPAINDK
ncbi:MAG: hypothetical protein JSS49_16145 [Planctomycetes bacterium]|nr:hypothetical protein [Planctomycetota bacterium]